MKKGINGPNANISSLVTALAGARRRAGLNQMALGRRIGSDQSYVSKVERGGVDPQISTLVELARALDFELMLVPRQLVPAVQALQREIAPDPRNDPSTVDQDLVRVARDARGLRRRYPALPALSEVATAADELRIARVDESVAAKVRPLIESARAVITELRGLAGDRPPVGLPTNIKDATIRLEPITKALGDLRNQWVHRDTPSAPIPAYRLGDDDE